MVAMVFQVDAKWLLSKVVDWVLLGDCYSVSGGCYRCCYEVAMLSSVVAMVL